MTNAEALKERLLFYDKSNYDVFTISKGVPAGQRISNGYTTSIAPDGDGVFDLIQVAKNNTHIAFVWMQDGKVIHSSCWWLFS